VGPRAVLDAMVKRKIPSPRRESKLRTPTVQPVAQRCKTDKCVLDRHARERLMLTADSQIRSGLPENQDLAS
jgi:hypothetical protein